MTRPGAQTAEIAAGSVDTVIDEARVAPRHVMVLVLSLLVMAADGFDNGALAFAAPYLRRELDLSGTELGVLLSGSIAAGFFGPPLFGSLADRWGRRPVIIGGTLLFGLLTLAVVATTGFTSLLLLRMLGGVALAGTLPVVATHNNECAPRRYRASLVAVTFTGLTLGGALPGVVAAALVPQYGWHVLFVVGGLFPMVVAALMLFLLPESLRFLAARPERRIQLDRELRLYRLAATHAVASPHMAEPARRASLGELLRGELAVLTPLYWLSNFAALAGFYFMIQWLPTLLGDLGLPPARAALAAASFNAAGAVGGLVIMRLLDRYGFLPAAVLFGVGIPAVAAVGVTGLPPAVTVFAVALSGFCVLGANIGNIATEGNIYPTGVRGRGVGLCFAMGRLGGGLGPLLGGTAVSAGFSPSAIFAMVAAAPLLGLMAALAIVPRYRRVVVRMGAA